MIKRLSFGTLLLIFLCLQGFVSCTGQTGKDADTVQDSNYAAAPDASSMADNDIAMTVRSIADAINYGESLDSASYSYTGVLTDGRSRPLYTDRRGRPGEWSVRVTGPAQVVITNLYSGDLFTEALKNYLASALSQSESGLHPVALRKSSADDRREAYDFGSGIIIFSVRVEEKAESGPEEFMEIILQGKA